MADIYFLNISKHCAKSRSNSAFTIVELLVVIVTIGVLAAITTVSYAGISQKAVSASLVSDLNNASKLLKIDQATNGAYPSTLAEANGGKGILASQGTLYQYVSNNNIKSQTFILYATKNGVKYRITDSSSPVKVAPVAATGGTVVDIDGFRIHTFTSSGTLNVTSGDEVEVLVVAGGGGGSVDRAGGGGGGGLIYNSTFPINPQTYTVTVGAGGAGTAKYIVGANGGNSVFNSLVAVGGGGGGTGGGLAGANGGSGGGGGNNPSCNPCSGGSATLGQGNKGGLGVYTGPYYGAGGGGGAGSAGANGTSISSGDGGAGLSYSISGSIVYYSGGGGAGSYNGGRSGVGGVGGGGNGGQLSATAGITNSGGGGGSSGNIISSGGSGGSGIVIFRYPI